MTSNAQSLLQYWNLPTENDLRRLEVGFLNETFAVKTEHSEFILRIYQSEGSNIARMTRENDLLNQLAALHPSFELPVFIPGSNGEQHVRSIRPLLSAGGDGVLGGGKRRLDGSRIYVKEDMMTRWN